MHVLLFLGVRRRLTDRHTHVLHPNDAAFKKYSIIAE